MKRLIVILLLIFSRNARAQVTFTVQHDTVSATPSIGSGTTVLDGVSAIADSIKIAWKVVASDFPPDWLHVAAICDNHACVFTTTLWSPSAGTTAVEVSNSYGQAHDDFPGGDFHMLIGFTDTSTTGCHYMTVRMNNLLLPPDTVTETYIICNHPLTTPAITWLQGDVVLYPNPAYDEVKLICDPALDVKKAIVCDIMGNTVAAYSIPGKIDTRGLSRGIYFVRAVNSAGSVIATRRLAKQ